VRQGEDWNRGRGLPAGSSRNDCPRPATEAMAAIRRMGNTGGVGIKASAPAEWPAGHELTLKDGGWGPQGLARSTTGASA
jgi:hypothetical protein